MPSRKVSLLLLCTIAANNTFSYGNILNQDEDNYSPVINFLAIGNRNRKIGEIDLLYPLLERKNNLFLTDIKIKSDNGKSIEYNLGLVYRRNVADKWVLGFYNYFDRRISANNFGVNQWTVGLEALNNYIEGRINVYIPQNKAKIVKRESIELKRDKTKIFAVKKYALEEHAFGGYDLELGVPVFAIFPELNQKFETKFFATRYEFKKKNIGKNSGLVLRVEQPIKIDSLCKRDSELILSFGTNKRDGGKLNNFVGLSLRMSLNRNSSNFKKSGVKKLMMNNVVRDVDIITSSFQESPQVKPVFYKKHEINNIYFVGITSDGEYEGDGSYENPFSVKQLLKLKQSNQFAPNSNSLILPILLDENILTSAELKLLNDTVNECSVTKIENNEPKVLEVEGDKINLENNFPKLIDSQVIINSIQNDYINSEEPNIFQEDEIDNEFFDPSSEEAKDFLDGSLSRVDHEDSTTISPTDMTLTGSSVTALPRALPVGGMTPIAVAGIPPAVSVPVVGVSVVGVPVVGGSVGGGAPAPVGAIPVVPVGGGAVHVPPPPPTVPPPPPAVVIRPAPAGVPPAAGSLLAGIKASGLVKKPVSAIKGVGTGAIAIPPATPPVVPIAGTPIVAGGPPPPPPAAPPVPAVKNVPPPGKLIDLIQGKLARKPAPAVPVVTPSVGPLPAGGGVPASARGAPIVNGGGALIAAPPPPPVVKPVSPAVPPAGDLLAQIQASRLTKKATPAVKGVGVSSVIPPSGSALGITTPVGGPPPPPAVPPPSANIKQAPAGVPNKSLLDHISSAKFGKMPSKPLGSVGIPPNIFHSTAATGIPLPSDPPIGNPFKKSDPVIPAKVPTHPTPHSKSGAPAHKPSSGGSRRNKIDSATPQNIIYIGSNPIGGQPNSGAGSSVSSPIGLANIPVSPNPSAGPEVAPVIESGTKPPPPPLPVIGNVGAAASKLKIKKTGQAAAIATPTGVAGPAGRSDLLENIRRGTRLKSVKDEGRLSSNKLSQDHENYRFTDLSVKEAGKNDNGISGFAGIGLGSSRAEQLLRDKTEQEQDNILYTALMKNDQNLIDELKKSESKYELPEEDEWGDKIFEMKPTFNQARFDKISEAVRQTQERITQGIDFKPKIEVPKITVPKVEVPPIVTIPAVTFPPPSASPTSQPAVNSGPGPNPSVSAPPSISYDALVIPIPPSPPPAVSIPRPVPSKKGADAVPKVKKVREQAELLNADGFTYKNPKQAGRSESDEMKNILGARNASLSGKKLMEKELKALPIEGKLNTLYTAVIDGDENKIQEIIAVGVDKFPKVFDNKENLNKIINAAKATGQTQSGPRAVKINAGIGKLIQEAKDEGIF